MDEYGLGDDAACRCEREGAGAGGCAQAQAVLMGMLSRALLRPDEQFAAELADGSFEARLAGLLDTASSPDLAAAFEVLGECRATVGSADPEAIRRALEVEYNRLFVGPGKLIAPPYGSYYASAADGGTGRLRTAEECEVASAYKACGYTVPEMSDDFADHLAVELGFLALLARDEAAAWRCGDSELAQKRFREAENFTRRHLRTWIGRCADRVDGGARLGLYPAILRIARVVVGA